MFNSFFHFNSFINALKIFLKQFPDYRGLSNIELIKKRVNVVFPEPLGPTTQVVLDSGILR